MQKEPDKLMEGSRGYLKSGRPKTETLLTSKDTADYLNVTPDTLKRWRRKGRGPRFFRLPALRYRLADVDAFLRECLDSNSSETPK